MTKKIILLIILASFLIYSLTACSLLDKMKNKEQRLSESDVAQENETETDSEGENGTITPVETSLESPAKVGEWMQTLRYSTVDGAYHIAYFRIKEIVRDKDKVQKVIDEYNDMDHNTYFDDIEDKDLEYCLIKYELYFPEDFPAENYGINSANIDFSITTTNGNDIVVGDKKYTNLNCVYDVSKPPEANTLNPGQTYKDGRAIFCMVKDFKDYLLKSYYLNGGQLVYSYIKGK